MSMRESGLCCRCKPRLRVPHQGPVPPAGADKSADLFPLPFSGRGNYGYVAGDQTHSLRRALRLKHGQSDFRQVLKGRVVV
jgi:hypothetical protein